MSCSLSCTRLGPFDSSDRLVLLPLSARMAESLEAMVSLFTWQLLDERMLQANRYKMLLYIQNKILENKQNRKDSYISHTDR